MTSEKVGITVIICTYNGTERLLPTLSSIINQEFQPSLFELIVVNNASHDDTPEFCKQILSNAVFHWRIVEEPNLGLNHARLKGLAEAKFDIVLFCDDDNSLSLDYLQIAFELFKGNPRIGALGGCGIPAFEGAKPEWFDRYSHSFAVGPQADRDGKILNQPAELYGAGTFFRKKPLLDFFAAGFEAIMTDRKGNSLVSGGDVEYCYLIQLSGYEIWYDHRLTFTHFMPVGRMTWAYYLRLKEGITAGTALLLPYTCLIGNNNFRLLQFCFSYISKMSLATLLYIKHRSRNAFKARPLDDESKLALAILRARMASYWLNGLSSFTRFRDIKSLL